MAFKNLELRVFKGNITLHEIAEELDVHLNTVWRWFNQGEMNDVNKQQVEQAIIRIKERRKDGTA